MLAYRHLMKYQDCIKALKNGQNIAFQRISDDDYDVYECLESFLDVWPTKGDFSKQDEASFILEADIPVED